MKQTLTFVLFFVLVCATSCASTPEPISPTPEPPQTTPAPQTITNPDGLWLSELGFYVIIQGEGSSVTSPDLFRGSRPNAVQRNPNGELVWTQTQVYIDSNPDISTIDFTVTNITDTHLTTTSTEGDQQHTRTWVRIDGPPGFRSYDNQSITGSWQDGVANVTHIEADNQGNAKVTRESAFDEKSKIKILETGWNEDGFFFWTSKIVSWDPVLAKPNTTPITLQIMAQNKEVLVVGVDGSLKDMFILTPYFPL